MIKPSRDQSNAQWVILLFVWVLIITAAFLESAVQSVECILAQAGASNIFSACPRSYIGVSVDDEAVEAHVPLLVKEWEQGTKKNPPRNSTAIESS